MEKNKSRPLFSTRGMFRAWLRLSKTEYRGNPCNNGPCFWMDITNHHGRLTSTDRKLSKGINQPTWARTRRGKLVMITQ